MSVMHSRREGFALAGAVLAMVLVGAIVTGGFYAANQESQVTRSADVAAMAQYIAEVGLDITTGRSTFATMNGMLPNQTITVYTDSTVRFGGRVIGNFDSQITRITATLFVVTATGEVTTGGMNSGATRTLSTVVKLRNANFDSNSAMQVYGDLNVAGNSDVDGDDVQHTSWSGCTTSTNSAAVTANPGSTISTSGNGNIDGTVDQSQPLTPEDFTVFGDITLEELARMADKKYSVTETNANPEAHVVSGQCITTTKSNWGFATNATHACANYFPIIYAAGDLTIQSNGYGQGILIVQGNLDIQGQFNFYGPVVVYGTIEMAGTADIYGNVFAFGGGTLDADNNLGTGTSVVQYSSCAIERAAEGANALNRAIPIRNRAFIDVTSVQNSY